MECCPFKKYCYRRNPHHFKQFHHPHLLEYLKTGYIPDYLSDQREIYLEQLDILRILNGESSNKSTVTTVNVNKVKPETMIEQLKIVEPYNIFYTTIPKSIETEKYYNSITFPDLLCPTLGILKCSLQINFMIDIDWLIKQYKIKNQHCKPLTILYGSSDFVGMEEFIDKYLPNVTRHYVKLKDPFGVHHSKIGIYVYEDNSLRVVVSTANLYYEDWNNYNQGLWLSPLCRRLPDDSKEEDGESPTGFKISLLHYLRSYNVSCLNGFIDYVKKADFSDVNVFLVTSIPGKHYFKNNYGCHLHRVSDLLMRHCNLPKKTTPESEGPLAWVINAQASSIGSFGKSSSDWLRGTFLRSLSAHNKSSLVSNSNAILNIIYPTVSNVLNGYFGPESGGCLPYSKKTHESQKWLQNYLYQWKADKLNRTKAMPHIKTYCRISPCMRKLAWYLLTSANISKSAWGNNIQKDGGIYIRSYEAGVMFLPNFFNEEFFDIENKFPFMYDLPLTPFINSDYPWCN